MSAGSRTAVAPSAAGLLAVAGILYLVAGLTGSGWLLLACAAVLVLPVVAVVLRPRVDGVVVGRRMAPRVTVGGTVLSTLVVRNDGPRRSPELVVLDSVPGLEDVRLAVPALPPGGTVEVAATRTALQRCRAPAGTLQLDAIGPFGLVRTLRDVVLEGVVHVHPVPAAPPRLPAAAAPVWEGAVPSGRAGPGTEVLQLREWRSGDGARAVSARASARHGRPIVLERERDSTIDLVVLVAGPGRGEHWEAALASACGAALRSSYDGRPPWLLGAGHEAAPRPGPRDVLDWFAAADEAGPLDDAVLRRALHRATSGGVLLAVVPVDDIVERMRVRRAAAGTGVPVVVLDG